jgi:putative membrane protein
MTRAAIWLLSAGVLLFAAVLISQGLSAVLATLAVAGWGLLLVALMHVLPLALDGASIRVLFRPGAARNGLRRSTLARWAGESANSFLPAGPIGGPVVMARHLSQSGVPMQDAAAVITVSTTLQTLAQVVFAIIGMALLAGRATQVSQHAVRTPLLLAGGVLALCLAGFYLLQRRGLFGKLMRITARFSGQRDWSQRLSQADAIDAAVERTYGLRARVSASFALSLAGWLIGTAEVFLILRLVGSAVSWADALLLESLGQAIRSAGFAIPGSLGVQEGGFLLLAPLAGLEPDVALALSLAKRAREIVFGVPGLLFIHLSERSWRRRHIASATLSD